LIEAPIIRKAIIRLVKESEPELFLELRNALIDSDSSFKEDIPLR